MSWATVTAISPHEMDDQYAEDMFRRMAGVWAIKSAIWKRALTHLISKHTIGCKSTV
jgi:hypothetical protein